MDAPQELLKLLSDTKKQLEHLRVLGVEGIRGTATAAPIDAPREKPLSKPVIDQAPPESSRTPVASLFGEVAPAATPLLPSNESFEQIHAEIGDCIRCPLHQERTRVVHTEGDRK